MVLKQGTGLLYINVKAEQLDAENKFLAWAKKQLPTQVTGGQGLQNACLYTKNDGTEPKYLILYDTATNNMITSDLQKQLPNISGVQTQLRFYEQYSEVGSLKDGAPSASIWSVGIYPKKPEYAADVDAFYEGEHTELLSKTPGWIRTRRYHLVPALIDEPASSFPPLLSIHEFDSYEATQRQGIKETMNTPWFKEAITKWDLPKMEGRIYDLKETY